MSTSSGWFSCCWPSRFFFFQAEDGIRDVAVTGVQTCALPIYACRIESSILAPVYGRCPIHLGQEYGHQFWTVLRTALPVQPESELRSRTGVHTLDRKSTRLNSSHGYISYAVFCLKTKRHQHC